MDDMKDTDSNTLARIDERTSALTTAFALHVKEDGERFEKMFNFMTQRSDKTDGKLDTLWDDKNKRTGAISISKLLSGGMYAVIALAAGYFGSEVHK